MTSIQISRARRWGMLLAGFALVAAACSSYAGTSGGLVAESAVAPTPAASAAAAPSAAPSAATVGGGRYGNGDDAGDYGGVAASPRASADSGGSADAAVVKVASGSIGTFLTGANGMTLYVFQKDSPDKSACSGVCAANWPPFVVGAGANVTAGDGVTGKFTTFKRDDGTMQVAYKGAPLYYFVRTRPPATRTARASRTSSSRRRRPPGRPSAHHTIRPSEGPEGNGAHPTRGWPPSGPPRSGSATCRGPQARTSRSSGRRRSGRRSRPRPCR